MTKIFISHASEDKDEFVRPLAEALNELEEFEVWYDEYELKWGDSLFREINNGLSNCDYAIVVFSKDFFKKEWPQEELNGLFALEKMNGKLILPIWKDITKEEITQYTPVIAERLAIKSTEGIPKIISELMKVVGVSNRTKEIVSDEDYLKEFSDSLLKDKERNENTEKLHRQFFVDLINEGAKKVLNSLHNSIEGILKKTHPDIFYNDQQNRYIKQQEHYSEFILKSSVLKIAISYRNPIVNSADEARLSCELLKWDPQRRMNDSFLKLFRLELKPYITITDKIRWVEESRHSSNPLSEKQVVKLFISRLTSEIHKFGNKP
jgi:DNA polymerase III alpha subunit